MVSDTQFNPKVFAPIMVWGRAGRGLILQKVRDGPVSVWLPRLRKNSGHNLNNLLITRTNFRMTQVVLWNSFSN